MATKREDRYASPQLLAEDVERFLADEPVTAFSEPVSVAARRWLRRHPKGVTALAATVLIGLTSTIVIAAVVSGKNRQLAQANNDLMVASTAERAARIDAETERRVAEQAKQQAQQHFDLALEAIETFHTGVSEDVLLKEKGLTDLRKKLLEGPLEFEVRENCLQQ